jgi:hypothetical protein
MRKLSLFVRTKTESNFRFGSVMLVAADLPKCRKAASYDGRSCPLYLGLFGQFQRIIDVYSQVPYGTFKLGVAQQKLHGPKVLSPPVHQRCLTRLSVISH